MDLSLIITHLDNFVDTWEGWGKVFAGLETVGGFDGLSASFSALSSATEGGFEALSSTADNFALSADEAESAA